MDFEHVLQPDFAPRISPKLIASTKLLSLSSQELAQRLSEEARENPALEIEEIAQCPTCGSPLEYGGCPTCSSMSQEEQATSDVRDWNGSDLAAPLSSTRPSDGDPDYDVMTRVQSEETLTDHLLRGLAALVSAADMEIAEYLVGSLDDRGYLSITLEQVAMALDASLERVESVLVALQSLEPAGIGARDVTECMLLQLKALEEQGVHDPYAERIIAKHLRDAAGRRWHDIASALGATCDDIHDSYTFIKEHLNPFPANGFVPQGNRSTRGFQPDVIIRQTSAGTFEVEVVEASRFDLRINTTYQELSRRYRESAHAMSPTEHEHVKTHVARARFFIDCVRQRWETLQRITTSLIEYQRDFLLEGVSQLKPLTRSELAEMIGLHPSTVSRATADKYIMLPNGRTIPFHDFFDASLTIKDSIKEIIREELANGNAMSDQQIVYKLECRQLHVARRTVAKYRDVLRILPSRSR